MPKKLEIGIGQQARVRYRTKILNPDGSIARERDWHHNLLLDTGLDFVASNTWVGCFNYCAVGTGITPTNNPSSAITFTQSGTTLTASASFFQSTDVGALFKFGTGTGGAEMYVTAFTSSTVVTVSVSGTVGTGTVGTLWYVDQTGLTTEKARTGNLQTPNNTYNFSTMSGSVITHQRTFLFPAVGSGVTYTEIGWSPNSGAGANLFGRDLIPGGGDSLAAGQQYQVQVQLLLTVGPASSTTAPSVITGWTAPGNCCLEYAAFAAVNGTASFNGNSQSAEPSNSSNLYAATATTALQAMSGTTPVSLSGLSQYAGANGSYVSKSFTQTRSVTMSTSQANGSINSVGISDSVGTSSFRVLFSSTQTKDNAHTLTIVFRFTWGRQLSN